MRCTFRTSTGHAGRTSSTRRYVVVDRLDAEIFYRTDDVGRAVTRAREIGYRHRAGADVIDTHSGSIVGER